MEWTHKEDVWRNGKSSRSRIAGKTLAAAKAYFAAIAARDFKLAKKYAADDMLKETLTMEKNFAKSSDAENKKKKRIWSTDEKC